MGATLVLIVTLQLPAGPQTDRLRVPMPSMEQCRRAGRDYKARSDALHHVEFECRPVS